jgi:FkbM family methyltransferase
MKLPPAIFRTLAAVSRATPYFRGKWRFVNNVVRRWVVGKNYRSIRSIDKGVRIILDLDDWIPYHLFWFDLYEKNETKLFRSLVHSGMIILDVGANIGYYTLQAAGRVGPSGHVHAFEPVYDTFTWLRSNILINKFTNITANRCVVGNRKGEVSIFVADKSDTGRSSLSCMSDFSGKTEVVDSITMDDYLEQRNIAKVDLIKIDVEGSELSVLKGMQQLLSSAYQPYLMIEMDEQLLRSQNASVEEVLDYLESFGLVPFGEAETQADYSLSFADKSLVLFCPVGVKAKA